MYYEAALLTFEKWTGFWLLSQARCLFLLRLTREREREKGKRSSKTAASDPLGQHDKLSAAYPSAQPPFYLFIHQCTDPSIHPSIHQSINQSIYPYLVVAQCFSSEQYFFSHSLSLASIFIIPFMCLTTRWLFT